MALAAGSRVGGEGMEAGDLRGDQRHCLLEPQCAAGKDQTEKEGWRQMGASLREHSAERLWPYLLKNLPPGII